jgi:hypothetical protein
MARKRPLLTPALETTVVAYVRAGGFPHVAAEAAGVPREVFDDWLLRGKAAVSSTKYHQFFAAVMRAAAEARLNAEVAALQDKPMDWLKYGPGKERAAVPGWSALAKAQAPAGEKKTSPLLDPDVRALLRALMQALEPYPDARAALGRALPGLTPTE